MMFTPLGRAILPVEPVNVATFAGLRALVLSVFVAVEMHEWTWAMRERYAATSRLPIG